MTLDTDAFAAFYDDSLPLIYGYFLRRCGYRVQIAQDLTQETYLAAVRQINRGTVVNAPLPWIDGIARHKLLDHFRAQVQQQNGAVQWDENVLDDVAHSESELDRAAELDRERVEIALAALPATQRAALMLRYLDGLPVLQVAELTGSSVHAVESLLARGRANLKRALTTISESDHD